MSAAHADHAASVEALRATLAPLAGRIRLAFVHGSTARGAAHR